MMDETIFLGFISNILNVEINPISNPLEQLDYLSQKISFDIALQPMYSSDYLASLINDIKDNTLHEITDEIGTSILLFRFQDKHYLLGPYLKTPLSDIEIQERLAINHVSGSLLQPVKLYYSQFPRLSTHMIQLSIMASMRAFLPNIEEYAIERIDTNNAIKITDKVTIEPDKTYAQIMQTYEIENYFLRIIKDGDMNGIELAMDTLATSFFSGSNKEREPLYANGQAGFSIIRTLARKAAEEGGASIIEIDGITKSSVQKYNQSRSTIDANRVLKEMVISLTKAVHKAKQEKKYSPYIRRSITYIQSNYSMNISLESLAQLNHVSPEHLSRLFQKEMGQTIGQYIAELRIKKSEELLVHGNLSISMIAAYVGYPDNNYFTKVFKKYHGITPSEYRNNHL